MVSYTIDPKRLLNYIENERVFKSLKKSKFVQHYVPKV